MVRAHFQIQMPIVKVLCFRLPMNKVFAFNAEFKKINRSKLNGSSIKGAFDKTLNKIHGSVM